MYCLRMRQVLKLPVYGGTTETVFPRTERKLNNSKYQEALEFVGSRKRMDRYMSMMDFLFNESFPSYRFACFRYYNNKGPRLADDKRITPLILEQYDIILCDYILELCMIALKEKRHLAWKDVLSEINRVCLAA